MMATYSWCVLGLVAIRVYALRYWNELEKMCWRCFLLDDGLSYLLLNVIFQMINVIFILTKSDYIDGFVNITPALIVTSICCQRLTILSTNSIVSRYSTSSILPYSTKEKSVNRTNLTSISPPRYNEYTISNIPEEFPQQSSTPPTYPPRIPLSVSRISQDFTNSLITIFSSFNTTDNFISKDRLRNSLRSSFWSLFSENDGGNKSSVKSHKLSKGSGTESVESSPCTNTTIVNYDSRQNSIRGQGSDTFYEPNELLSPPQNVYNLEGGGRKTRLSSSRPQGIILEDQEDMYCFWYSNTDRGNPREEMFLFPPIPPNVQNNNCNGYGNNGRGDSKFSSRKIETFQQYYRDGLTAFKENDFKGALVLFNKAITLNPKNIQLYDCRAATREKLGQLKDAQQDAETMMRLDRSSAKGYLRAGKLYRLLNQHDKAQEVYNLGEMNIKKNDPLYETIRTYVGRGRLGVRQVICPRAQKLTNATLKHLRATFGIRLQKVVLTHNSSITNDAIVPFIRAIGSHLKWINLSDTNIMDKGVVAILSTCSKLELLDLSHCSKITAQAFDPGKIQCRATGMRVIKLDYSYVAEVVITFMIAIFPKLTSLGIRGVVGLTNESLVKLANFPNLNSLYLEGNTSNGGSLSINDAFISLASSCPPLREFSLERCTILTDNCVRNLIASCHLEVLELNGDILLTDETMQDIGAYCKRLKILRIGKSPGITDNGVLSLFVPGGEISLEVVDLRQNSNISNISLEKIADNCGNLKELNVQWCGKITGSGVAYLVEKRGKTLKHLFLEECFNVSPDAVEYARKVIGSHGGK
ncbi:14695_t:CDS:2, partial [Acaulospora colombiana]